MNSFKVVCLLVSAFAILSVSQTNAEETPFQVLYQTLTAGYEKSMKSFKESFGLSDQDKLFSAVTALTAKFVESAQYIASGIEKDSRPLNDELQTFVEKTTTKTSDFVRKSLESPDTKSKFEELRSCVEKILKPLEEAIDKFGKAAGVPKPVAVAVKCAIEDASKNIEKFRMKTLETIEKAVQEAKKYKY